MPGDSLHINNKATAQNSYDAIVIDAATMAAASSGVRMSPLPMTGIFTASLTCAIHSQRA